MVIGALDRIVVAVEDLRAVAGDDDPVAFFEIGDLLGQRRERERVGAEIGLALAVADHQRRAEPRADQQVGISAEQRSPARRRRAAAAAPPATASSRRNAAPRPARDRPDARRPRCRSRSRTRGRARCSSSRSGLKFSMMPLWTSATSPVACGWALSVGRRAMRRPAGVGDADRAGQRLARPARCARLTSLPSARGGGRARRHGRCRCPPNHSRDIRAACSPSTSRSATGLRRDADNSAHFRTSLR